MGPITLRFDVTLTKGGVEIVYFAIGKGASCGVLTSPYVADLAGAEHSSSRILPSGNNRPHCMARGSGGKGQKALFLCAYVESVLVAPLAIALTT